MTSTYEIQHHLNGVLNLVDPRETVAQTLLPHGWSDLLFYLNKKFSFVWLAITVIGQICALTSMVGIVPDYLGWLALMSIPAPLLQLMLYNYNVLRMVCKRGSFWFFLFLGLFWGAVMVVTVGGNQPRTCSIIVLSLIFIALISFDARQYTKKKPPFLKYYLVCSLLMAWLVLILYWAGQWRNVTETIWILNSKSKFSLQSAGFSAYFTLVLLLTRYAYGINTSKEINPCNVLYCPVSYCHISEIRSPMRSSKRQIIGELDVVNPSNSPLMTTSERTSKLGDLDVVNPSNVQTPNDAKLLAEKYYGTKGTIYMVRVDLAGIPNSVNPRHTIANVISPKFGNFCHKMYRNPIVGLMVLVSYLCGISIAFVSVIGLTHPDGPEIGWYSAVCVIGYAYEGFMYNRTMLHALFKTFNYWGLMSCLCISTLAMMDYVAFDPARSFALVMLMFNGVITIGYDARTFFKSNFQIFRKLCQIQVIAFAASTMVLYWAGQWRDTRESVVPLGLGFSLYIQSAGFSLYTNVVIVTTAFVGGLPFSKTKNRMVVLKGSVSYRPVQIDGFSLRELEYLFGGISDVVKGRI